MKQLCTLLILILSINQLLAQVVVSGQITDEYGIPLMGANVSLKNTFKGDQTEGKGYFVIANVNSGTYQVKASYVGFESQEKTIEVNSQDVFIEFALKKSTYVADEITVLATRATNKSATTFTNMSKEDIEKNNLGQDLPYLLENTPSVVVTSDAGAGVGYTGIRIRGSDPTRINVTINGIPLNDSESQGVFWVNLPDLASSTENIQIQRGVGTSTNGASAFGASVNVLTSKMNKDFSVQLNNSFGSFNTRKNTLIFNSGLLSEKFTVDLRASSLASDGYIDRASSDLRSGSLSAAYYGNHQSLRLNVLYGSEVTYQSWYGLNPSLLDSMRTFNEAGTEKPGDPYENQVDDYNQTHFQLLYTNEINKRLTLNGALHYTKGQGFYEEYKGDEILADYGYTSTLVNDLVRRRWLDNHFYGATYSANYLSEDRKLQLTLGGAANNYLGRHFGEVIDVIETNLDVPQTYYDNDATKFDFNIFSKANFQLTEKWNAFADLQYRRVNYAFIGIDDNAATLNQDISLDFFNPKVGITYDLTANTHLYLSYAIANKEPNRDDYTENPPSNQPVHENLTDLELGYRQLFNNGAINLNFYRMDYKNQLVLTGEINDVGAYTRVNIPNSYRMGVELDAGMAFMDMFNVNVNATLSQNKIAAFTEYLDDYDADFNWIGQTTIDHTETDIAFSPNAILGGTLTYDAFAKISELNQNNKLELSWLSKYVGTQYIDNTSSIDSQLDAYLTNDLRAIYTLKLDDEKFLKGLTFTFLWRNVFNELYENNAWIYRYQYDGSLAQSVGLYPQAGRHYYVGLNLTF